MGRITKQFDLHIHSHFSYDSMMKVENIIRTAQKKGLSGIAIADHDTIAGGLEGKKWEAPGFLVIVGAEYTTPDGHIIGLFMKDEIPPSRESEAVISAIHEQGGLAVLAHPYKYSSAFSADFLKKLDGVEIVNSRAESQPGCNLNNKQAEDLVRLENLGISAGSDAHFPWEIGRSVWQCEDIACERDVYTALKENRGRCVGRSSSIIFESMSQMIKAFKLKKWAIIPKTMLKIPYVYLRALKRLCLRGAGK